MPIVNEEGEETFDYEKPEEKENSRPVLREGLIPTDGQNKILSPKQGYNSE